MSRICCWIQQYLKTLFWEFHHGFILCNGPKISLFLLWGVLGFQFLRKSAGCYNLLWQVSLLSADVIVLVTHPLPNPHPISWGGANRTVSISQTLSLLPTVKKVLPLSLLKKEEEKKMRERLNLQRNPGTELEGDTTLQRHFPVGCFCCSCCPNYWGMLFKGVMGDTPHFTTGQWRAILNVVALNL